MSPVVIGCSRGDAQNFGGFLKRQSNEIAQLHQFGFNLVLSGEFVEGVVDSQELFVISRDGDFNAVNVHALLVAAATDRLFAAGAVDENPAHGFGGGSEEVGTILKLCLAVFTNQSQPGFVDQRGGLQGLVGCFVGHFRRRQLAQLLIYQRKQFIGSLGVAVLNGLKNLGNVAQSER